MDYLVEPEEIKRWYQGFAKDCPTGRLTKSEFGNIYKQFFPKGDSTQFAG